MLERKLRDIASKNKSAYSYVGSAFVSDKTKADLKTEHKEASLSTIKKMKDLKDAKGNQQNFLTDLCTSVDAAMSSENDAALRWIILSSRILRAINSEDSCNRLMNRLVHFSYSMYGVNNPKNVDENADNVDGDDDSDISDCSLDSHEDMVVPKLLVEKFGEDEEGMEDVQDASRGVQEQQEERLDGEDPRKHSLSEILKVTKKIGMI